MKKGMLLIFSLWIFSGIHSQTITNIDSAKRVLQTAKDDTAKVKLLYQITAFYSRLNNDSAFFYIEQQSHLAEKINYQWGKASASLALSYYSMGLGNAARTLEYAYKALHIAEQLHDTMLLVYSYTDISYSYKIQKNFPECLRQAKKAYSLVEHSPDIITKANSLYSIALSYIYLNMPDSALRYSQESYRLLDSIADKKRALYPLASLAKIYSMLGKPVEAKMYCWQVISGALSMGDYAIPAVAYMVLAEQFLKEQRKDSALYYARASAGIIEFLNEEKDFLMSNYRTMVTVFKSNHQMDSAFKYQEKIIAVKDSADAQNNYTQLQSIAFEEKMRQQEQEAAVLKAKEVYSRQQEHWKNKVIVFSLLAALVVFGIIAFILYGNNRNKQKANMLLQKQKTEIQHQRDQTNAALTELKSTQVQLIQSEKMASLGELTAGIAHEIQNPLNFVNNFSEISVEMLDEQKEQINNRSKEEAIALAGEVKQNVQKVLYHGKRADAIVKSMLEHSRSSKGQKEPTDINALTDEYLQLSFHGFRAKDKNFTATVETHFDESIGKIEVVSQDIGRALLNLFNNAFYAVNERKKAPTLKGENYEPTVWVTTKKENDRLIITVRDNGSGIPQKVVDKIFQPFFTTKPTGQGTGLGLSLSYDIVKAHGGELKVETKEGKGAELVIQLPI